MVGNVRGGGWDCMSVGVGVVVHGEGARVGMEPEHSDVLPGDTNFPRLTILRYT